MQMNAQEHNGNICSQVYKKSRDYILSKLGSADRRKMLTNSVKYPIAITA